LSDAYTEFARQRLLYSARSAVQTFRRKARYQRKLRRWWGRRLTRWERATANGIDWMYLPCKACGGHVCGFDTTIFWDSDLSAGAFIRFVRDGRIVCGAHVGRGGE